jgi:hypothetical protein
LGKRCPSVGDAVRFAGEVIGNDFYTVRHASCRYIIISS